MLPMHLCSLQSASELCHPFDDNWNFEKVVRILYHFNACEESGINFLNNNKTLKKTPSRILKELLPGSYMNTCWFVSVAQVQLNFHDTFHLPLGTRRYRLLQIMTLLMQEFRPMSGLRLS
jgi:hypothetical protein